MRATALSCLLTFALGSAIAADVENNERVRRAPSSASDMGERIIVKMRTDQGSASARRNIQSALPQSARGRFQGDRSIGNSLRQLRFERLSQDSLQATLDRLRADADVEYAIVDKRRYAHALPNDPLFVPTTSRTGQWYLEDVEASAIHATDAWDLTPGSATTVVAVLDTGVRFDHPDLGAVANGGKLLPGYDFVSGESASSFLAANDGDDWDADPSDPGDWINSTDQQNSVFAGCEDTDSSWHGTRVAGIIGAATDNATGIAGTGWNTLILPVRVLGKCGGYDSDILAGMRWAAGLPVDGVPTNPYPAHIINMSLGAVDTCSAAYQSVIDELAGLGVLVVASAGNEGGPVDTPANCAGAVAVAGIRHAGTKVGYSSLGPQVAIAAPAGNCVNLVGACLNSIETTTNTGITVPASSSYTDQYNYNVGTSFSAPIVAGAAALMHSVNSGLTTDEWIERIRQTASVFPTSSDTTVPTCHVPVGNNDIQNSECNCTTSTCGAGMLNAHAAVADAQRPIARVTHSLTSTSVTAGQVFVLDAASSAPADNRTITSWLWTVTSGSATLSATNQDSVTVTSPASGAFTINLTITDDTGAQDSWDIDLTAPAASGGGGSSGGNSSGGGGGAMTWPLLPALFALRRLRARPLARRISWP